MDIKILENLFNVAWENGCSFLNLPEIKFTKLHIEPPLKETFVWYHYKQKSLLDYYISNRIGLSHILFESSFITYLCFSKWGDGTCSLIKLVETTRNYANKESLKLESPVLEETSREINLSTPNYIKSILLTIPRNERIRWLGKIFLQDEEQWAKS